MPRAGDGGSAVPVLGALATGQPVRYASYAGRIPPSVMLSYYAGLAAQPSMSLSAMLVRLASWIIRDIEQASLYGRLLHVANPVCTTDVFTDRWPESVAQQDQFAEHLHELVRSLEAMRRGEMFPNTMMDTLRDDFGDRVVTHSADQIAIEVGGGIRPSRQLYTRRGGVLLPAAAAAAAPIVNPSVSAARPHTFFGRKI